MLAASQLGRGGVLTSWEEDVTPAASVRTVPPGDELRRAELCYCDAGGCLETCDV